MSVITHVSLQSCMTVCATASTRVQTGVQVLLLLLTLQLPCVHSSDECSEVRRQMVNSSVHVLRHMVSLLWRTAERTATSHWCSMAKSERADT